MKRNLLLLILILLLGVIVMLVFAPYAKHDVEGYEASHATTSAKKVIQLRFGHNTPEDSALNQAALRYAKLVSERTNGEVEIAVYPAQQLGNDHQMVEMARQGDLDILLTPTAKMSVAVPSMQYADLPFYFPSPEDVYTMLDGEPGRMLLKRLEAIDLIGVTFWENGFKHFTANFPMYSPEDFKGKRIRVMKSRIIMEQFRSFDANPIPIDFHSTYKALEDKIVDGEENPLIAIVSMDFYKVQSHMTLSHHAYLGYVFSISQKRFKTLPLEVQKILLDTARELTPWERDETHKREAVLLDTIRAAGVKIHTLTPGEREAFAQKTKHIPAMFEQVVGPDILSKTEELLMKKYGPDPKEKKQIVIGLDMDLSVEKAAAAVSVKRGAQLAVDEINERGGLLGRPVRLLVREHQASSEKSRENLEYFYARGDVAAVIGGMHSAVLNSEIDLIHEKGVPFFSPWCSMALEKQDIPEDRKVIFRLASGKNEILSVMTDFMNTHHYQKPAILIENTAWGKVAEKVLSELMSKEGVEPVVILTYNRGKDRFEKELDVLEQSGADSLFLFASPREGGVLLSSMAKLAKPLPVMAHWHVLSGDFYQRNKTALEKVPFYFLGTVSTTDLKEKHLKDFEKRYRKTYSLEMDDSIASITGAVHAYDTVNLFAQAAKNAGSVDPKAVRHALEHIPAHDGLLKIYRTPFSPGDHWALDSSDYQMLTFGYNGRPLVAKGLK